MKDMTDFYPDFVLTEDTEFKIESYANFLLVYPLFPDGSIPYKYRNYLISDLSEPSDVS